MILALTLSGSPSIKDCLYFLIFLVVATADSVQNATHVLQHVVSFLHHTHLSPSSSSSAWVVRDNYGASSLLNNNKRDNNNNTENKWMKGCKILGLESKPNPWSQKLKPARIHISNPEQMLTFIIYSPSICFSTYSYLILFSPMFIKHARLRGRIETDSWRHGQIVKFAVISLSPRGWLNVEDCFNKLWPRFSLQQSWHLKDVVMTSSNQSCFINSFHDLRSFWENSEIRMIIYIHEHFPIYSGQWIKWRLLLKCQTNYILQIALGSPNHFCMLDTR
jgi:hypothetical protein